MSEEQKWPERGHTSADGKHYTHTNGRVFESSILDCIKCGMYDEEGHDLCGEDCHNGWKFVEGAYVPSADERVAEKAMREMIEMCQLCACPCDGNGREEHGCCQFFDKTCPARRYLADVIHDPKAWEVEA